MELTIDQALQQGIEAHKAGQVQEADQLYTAILQAQPKHPDANHNMGVLAVGVGKVQEALPFFKTALEANSSAAQYWLSYIDALIKLDRMDDARGVLDKAKEKGEKGDGFNKLERQLKDVKPSPNGASDIQDPPQDQLQPLINLYSQSKFEQALDTVSKLLQKFPNSSSLHNIQGAVNAGLGLPAAAIESYRQAILIKPDDTKAYNNMGVTLQDQGKLEEAIEAYKKALAIKPDYAEAFYNLGVILKDQGKLEEAIEAYDKALSITPYNAETYNNKGVALRDQGKSKAAIAAFNKALTIKPNFAGAYNNLGISLQEQGKLEEAVVAYNQALSIKPDYADALNNMGNTLQEQSKLDEAIQVYNNALALKPDSADTCKNIGRAYFKNGEYEKAKVFHQKAVRLNPCFNRLGLSQALQKLGNYTEAIEALVRKVKQPDL